MRRTPWSLALVLLAPSLLAGCTGGADSHDEPIASVAKFTAKPNKGILLRVLVITDEYFPVARANVVLVGLGVNGTTDDLGDAYFHIAKAGRYALHVHRAGYFPNQTKVVLDQGDAEPVVRVRLQDAPRDGHYSDFFYYSGLCGPTVFVQPASTSSDCNEVPNFPKPQARFILGRGLVYGYIELHWDESPISPKTMRMEVRFPEIGAFADGQQVLIAEGPDPLKVRIPAELLTDQHRVNGQVVHITAGLARNAVAAHNFQQEFTIEAQFDYFHEAPDVDPET